MQDIICISIENSSQRKQAEEILLSIGFKWYDPNEQMDLLDITYIMVNLSNNMLTYITHNFKTLDHLTYYLKTCNNILIKVISLVELKEMKEDGRLLILLL